MPFAQGIKQTIAWFDADPSPAAKSTPKWTSGWTG
jgi:hypothetical protein